MQYEIGKYCVFYHGDHLVGSPEFRLKVLTGQVRLRVRDICRQVCRENEVGIPRGVGAVERSCPYVSVPPKRVICDLERKMKGLVRLTGCNGSSPNCAGVIGAAGFGGVTRPPIVPHS